MTHQPFREVAANQHLRHVPLTPVRLELCCSPGHHSTARWLYSPSRLTGRIALSAAMALNLRGTVNRHLPFDPQEIAARFGFSFRRVAAMRSPGRNRWTVAYLTVNGEAVIMKIASADSSDSIRREHLNQQQFAGHVGQFLVPKALQFVQDDRWSAFSMERVHPVKGHPRFDIVEAVSMAVDLANFKGSGVTHGDFAPWNVIHSSQRWLVDWEHAGPFEPGVDLAYYVFASALIARFIPVEDIPIYLGDRTDTLALYIEATKSNRTQVLANIAQLAGRFRCDYPENRELKRCVEQLRMTNAAELVPECAELPRDNGR